jgi:hypothetical protein
MEKLVPTGMARIASSGQGYSCLAFRGYLRFFKNPKTPKNPNKTSPESLNKTPNP